MVCIRANASTCWTLKGANGSYWVGTAGAANGSVGAAGAYSCQITLVGDTVANERLPVVAFYQGLDHIYRLAVDLGGAGTKR